MQNNAILSVVRFFFFLRKLFQSKCERHVQTNGYCATKEANTKILQRRIPIVEPLISLTFIELKKAILC